jgi:hypothetical protein
MSVKSLTLIAGIVAGTFAFGDRASAQVVGVTGGYTYSPGVVTTSYYTPASSWSYYSSPAYYSTPYMSSYYAAPIYGGYYSTPYYGGYSSSYYAGYPYYGSAYSGVGARRWWWR